MKKFFLILVFLMFNLSTYAQSHIEFKGIPLTGHIDGFMQKMQNKGFGLVCEYDKSVVWYKGKFAGFAEADIYVATTPATQTVYHVSVLSEQKSWHDLKELYFEYKDLFKKKYGDPVSEKEIFIAPYYEGDGYELKALRENKCEYYSKYKLNGGTVTVLLTFNVGMTVFQISYNDSIGIELLEMEKMSDI